MAKTRTSKLKRKAAPPIRLTERDIEIIRALHAHRFLTTQHLQTLTNTKSRWAINARLRLLYDHKYIDRPYAQKALYSHADKRPVIYALGNKGASLLSTQFNTPMPPKVYWTEKNRRVREAHIEHTLGISDFVISVEVMCRTSAHLEFITPKVIIAQSPSQTQRVKHPFRWKTEIYHHGERHEVAILPDYVFGIRTTRPSGRPTERYYFVEIDRGTMPVTRRDIRQTSYLRKILSYADTFERSLAERRFGMRGFQVLTVTTSEQRINAIQAAISTLTMKSFSANTFLFKTKSDPQTHFPFHSGWQNAKGAPADIASDII